MSEEPKRINYNLAKAEADKVDEQIIAALQNGNSFRVEAGAGSGKTYHFETYAPMITGRSSIPKGKEASFERNRNLFYVCCSRAKKRLFLFVTIPTDYEFKTFLMSLIGKDNIYTYSQFLEMER